MSILLGGCRVQTDSAVESTPAASPNVETAKPTETRKMLSLDDAINATCPRSGKPIVADSLTSYRGHVVGFCNTHCRDDFAGRVEECHDDRAAFDAIIDALESDLKSDSEN